MARLAAVAVLFLALSSVVPGTALGAAPLGPVLINDGAELTNNPSVTVRPPFPVDDSGLIRLSNDAASWTAPIPWQETLTWDISGVATGGSADDGVKTIYVQYDDGSASWALATSGSITLDRTPPSIGDSNVLCSYSGGWVTPFPCFGWKGDVNGTGPMEFSLDGGPWTNVEDVWAGGFDFREMRWGGGWGVTDRQVCVRAWDVAGNVSNPECNMYNLSIPDRVHTLSGDLYDVRFEFPLPAVTGQPFTIRPKFPSDWPATMPDKALCEWTLTWGDEDERGIKQENENYRQVWIKHLYKNGGCNDWTFTLPYSPGLTYKFKFQVMSDWARTVIYATQINGTGSPTATTFHATVGTHELGIPNSSHGLAYLLPQQTESQPGEPVTFTLHGSNTPGWSLPAAGYFWAVNNICEHLFGNQTPTTNRTYTYTPDCQGPWNTGWTWEDFAKTREYVRAEFDPPADKAPPIVSSPGAVVLPGQHLTSTVPVRLSWSSNDPIVKTVNTGVAKNALQVSRNAGAWTNVTLSSPGATSATVNLQPTGSYRFRARAIDVVGNRSAWATGPLLHMRLKQQGSATLSGSWSTQTRTALSGGSALSASSPGSAAQFSFSARSVSWIGSVGPGSGFAQVYLDGALAATVNLARSTARDQQILYSKEWAGIAAHTLRIVVLGTHGHPAVSIDALAVVN
jgi:hypothetical protein